MSDEPTPPIFVWEPADLATFDSVAEAESYLEPVDVRGELYTAYDADGRRLALGIRGEPSSFLWKKFEKEFVTIRCDDNSVSHRGELQRILTEYLVRIGSPVAEVVALSWEQLVATARRASLIG